MATMTSSESGFPQTKQRITASNAEATSTNKIYVGVNQPQNGVPQDRPIHLLVF